jgi:hypothetical protein
MFEKLNSINAALDIKTKRNNDLSKMFNNLRRIVEQRPSMDQSCGYIYFKFCLHDFKQNISAFTSVESSVFSQSPNPSAFHKSSLLRASSTLNNLKDTNNIAGT